MPVSARALILALLTLTPGVLAAQVGPVSGPVTFQEGTNLTCPLDGMVVNSVTGEPIRRALVQAPTGSQLTRADGKFHFPSVPVGQYFISATKPGYFNEQEIAQGTFRYNPTQVAPNMPPLVLKLTPEGVIYGRITGADNEPIENLPVKAMAARMVNGRRVWEQRGGRQTDDDGRFRIAELRPGTYYLKVGPGTQVLARGRNSSTQRRQGYAGTFYPGAQDLDSAAPFKIEPGQQYRAEFALQPAPFYQVTGTVAGVPADTRGVSIQINTPEGDYAEVSGRYTAQTGTFTIDAIPAGSYILTATAVPPPAQGGGPRQMWTGRVPLTVQGDVAGMHIALSPPVSIPVNIRQVSTGSAQTASRPDGRYRGLPVNVMLIGTGEGALNTSAGSSYEGPPGNQTLVVRNVQPGTYRAQFMANGNWYVDSARSGNVDLLREDLTVPYGGSVEPIEIVARDDAATLRGAVSSKGQPATGIIVFIPTAMPRLAKTGLTEPDGTFMVGGLAPGDYRVVALDRVDDLDYTDLNAMQEFSAGMQTIPVAPSQQATINLELQRREK